MRILTKSIHRAVLVAVAGALNLMGMDVTAQPLVTGDLTIYYDFDSFTDVVMDGSGNNFNGKVRDSTRNMTDPNEIGQLFTSGVISNDTSSPKRGAGAIRFTQSDIPGEDPVYLDMDGGVIKANNPTKVPSAAATYAAWVNLEPINTANGWNVDASILQGSTAGPGHAVPHLQAQGDGTFRLSLRNETSVNIANSAGGGSPWSTHPYTNQPEIDADPNTPPEPWPANEWFHLAATYDKNANGGAGEFALYYNGTKIRGGQANGDAGAADLGAWDIRSFGQYYDGLGVGAVYDSGSRRLHGLMDELYIFTRALSEEEIGTLAMLAAPGQAGDFSGNGSVENADLTLLLDNWGQPVPPTPAGWVGDPPTPVAIDNDELTRLLDNWGAGGGGVAAAGVPEPAVWLLSTIMLVVVAFGRRR